MRRRLTAEPSKGSPFGCEPAPASTCHPTPPAHELRTAKPFSARPRSWEIGRRACLRGVGASIGLPMLEVMMPGIKRARAAGDKPVRLLFFHFTGGTPDTTGMGDPFGFPGLPGCLRPKTIGSNFETTPLLQPLDDLGLKQDILVISNLNNYIAFVGKGPSAGGDHQRSEAAIYCGVDPQYADDPNATADISVDQVAASHLKQFTPGLPSLYVSNASTQSMSWSNKSTRVYPIDLPSRAFSQVFGTAGVDPAAAQKSLARTKGLLHYLNGDVKRLQARLGATDRQTLDKYLTSIGDLEQRISASGASNAACGMGFTPEDPKNKDLNSVADFPNRTKQMLDIIALAFQCDRTRVAMSQLYTHGIWFRFLGAPANQYPSYHDDIEHGGNASVAFGDDADRFEAYKMAAAWQIGQFGYLVRKLKDMLEPDGGTVLDNTVACCTSEFGYGDGHVMYNLPVIVAGRGRGAVSPGRHIAMDGYLGRPIAGLWLSMLNAVGLEMTSFGNSQGAVALK